MIVPLQMYVKGVGIIMNPKIRELLNLWYACLIDHHKDRDCYFYIKEVFCCYGKVGSYWLVGQDGYLYEWEERTDLYIDACKILEDKLKEQIKTECLCIIENPEEYIQEQINIIEQNLKKLKGIIND